MEQAAANEEFLQESDDEIKRKKRRSDDVGVSKNESNDMTVVNSEPSPTVVLSSEDEEDLIGTRRSRKGQFGWIYMRSIQYVPFLYRFGIKYLWEATLVTFDSKRWINCDNRKVKATEAEVKLLKDINSFHCDNRYKAEGDYYLIAVDDVQDILDDMLTLSDMY